MSNFMEVISFVISLVLFVGVIGGAVYAAKTISNALDEAKKSLDEKGVKVSASGISVKTDKQMTREDYLDATQRNVVKAIQSSTISVPDQGVMAHPDEGSRSPSIKRSSTNGSNRSADSTKKKSGLFGIRKSVSKHSNHGT